MELTPPAAPLLEERSVWVASFVLGRSSEELFGVYEHYAEAMDDLRKHAASVHHPPLAFRKVSETCFLSGSRYSSTYAYAIRRHQVVGRRTTTIKDGTTAHSHDGHYQPALERHPTYRDDGLLRWDP
jgi:hypothetical protein